jgi:hypothetical protein
MPDIAWTHSERLEPLHLRPGRLHWRDVDGEIVALDVDNSEYFAINHSGSLLWTELAGGSTREQLVAKLVREYTIDSEIAARDVDDFINGLVKRDLLARG